MIADELVNSLLEYASPFEKEEVILEYRPYRFHDQWAWFWVLIDKAEKRAVAHGEAESRAAASTAARLRARKLGAVIYQVRTAKYVKGLR